MVAEVPQSPHSGREEHKMPPDGFQCIHCGGHYMSWPALTFHLARCPKREYPRTFTIGRYQFIARLNPLKRPVMALKSLAAEPKVTDQVFLGACLVLQKMNVIHSFEVLPAPAIPATAKSGGSPRPMP